MSTEWMHRLPPYRWLVDENAQQKASIAALINDREALYELLNRAQHHMAPRLVWIDDRERDDYLRTMQHIDAVLALWRHAREKT